MINMIQPQRQRCELLDCTIRDGGYLNHWRFEKKMVREVYRSLSKAGIDIVEIGFRGTEKYFDRKEFGLWRFTDLEDLIEVTQGIQGAKLAIMGDYGKIDASDIPDEYRKYIDLIRIAVHRVDVPDALKLLQKLKKRGFNVSLNAMGVTSYTGDDLSELKKMVSGSGIDYFYIADSYGSLLPDQLQSLIELFKELENIKIGFHPHNSLQMAFANTLIAIKSGIDILDCTIYGIGRGAGNLQTEVILAYLQLLTKDKYNVIPVLNCIERFFINMEVEESWGYQLPYMLSGIFKCHPYYPKTLMDYREYSMEDIWNALEIIEKSNPIGFSKELLNRIIESGMIRKSNDTTKPDPSRDDGNRMEEARKANNQQLHYRKVSYSGKYIGRDFLILANGPTLKQYKNKIMEFINRYDPVVLGANYLGGLFKPNYHAFNNKRRFIDYIDTVEPESRLLIGENIPKEMIQEYTDKDYDVMYFDDVLDVDFGISDGVIHSNCRTISVLLMGVAIVMGAERVFAVGMDGYIDQSDKNEFLFYKERAEPDNNDLIAERHYWNQKFIRQIDDYLKNRTKEGVHILTPTSYKSFFKGIENYI